MVSILTSAAVLVGVAGLLPGSGVASAAPSAPSANGQPVDENPIDWTVIATIIGKGGEDLPCRVGQHDTAIDEGFGRLHIEDGHGGFSPDPDLMQQAADTCTSNPDPAAKTTCNINDADGRSFIVVWMERIDSRAPDGRPVGIITAYYP